MSATREAALYYAERFGWKVVPVDGKRPFHKAWPKRATTDPRLIDELWQGRPRANVGLVAFESFVALDVDRRRNDDEALLDLEQELGPRPATPRYTTGDGWRELFAHPGGEIAGQVGGVQVKRGRQMIVAPPSIHPETGLPYEWDLHPDEAPLAPLPEPWLDRMRPQPTEPTPPSEGREDDWLLGRPPDEYVRILTGQEVPRSRKLKCPIPGHNDRTASFHVYESPQRGWFCFGCQRGGSIYDLAALLGGYSVPLRGTDFLTVQAALMDLYEERLLGG